MTSTMIIDQNVFMEMRDGTLMAAEVYRPGNDGKYPVILMRTPYKSTITSSAGYFKLLPAIQEGYAVVVAYVRGRFGSQGDYDLSSPQDIEGADCYDTVEWIAGQSWCDGNVGMVGESALGTVQWRTAREAPPHLKAIAPGLAGAPGDVGPETGDAPVNLNIAISLLLVLAGDVLDKMDAQGTDTSETRRMLDQVRKDPSLAYLYLPLKDVPQFKVRGIDTLWDTCLKMSASGSGFGSAKPYPFNSVKVPGLTYTNWYDPFSRNSFRSFLGLSSSGVDDYTRNHQHLLAGPWCHCAPQRVLGDIDFGPLADNGGSGASQHILAFFNKYLKGEDIELPVVRYFTMGSNTWNESSSWPLPGTEWQRYFLHSRGKANSCSGNGTLTRDEPGGETEDTYIYDPLNPVMTAGGRGGLAENGFIYGPVDQIYVEQRDDVLCYTSPEFTEDTEVSGNLELHLFASSSCVDTDFAAKLVDVYPDGRAYNVADGITRAQYRNSFTSSEPLVPNEITKIIIRMGYTSQLFKTGHRMRIDITSSNFPTNDRNMNTGNPIGTDIKGISAVNKIYHQGDYASYIDIPVFPGK